MPDIIRGAHHWVGAANITIPLPQVGRAYRRGTVRVLREEIVQIVEVFCSACRRPYDDCREEVCTLGDHHRGGPIGTRKKRKGLEDPEANPDDLDVEDVPVIPGAFL